MTDEQLIELWNERAAIIEYEGKRPRIEAELAAYAEARKVVGRTPSMRAVVLPIEIRRVLSETVNSEFGLGERKHESA